jgi:hypothetical protein
VKHTADYLFYKTWHISSLKIWGVL